MGAASAVISGVSQVAGIAQGFMGGGGGGGTQFVPDERAKYEADRYAFQAAVEGQKMQEDILKGQLSAQNSFNTYAFDLQNLQMDREVQGAYKNIITQYQDALYNTGLQRMQIEQQNYLDTQQYNTASLQNEANRFAAEMELGLNTKARKVDLAASQAQDTLSEAGIELSKKQAKYNLDMTNARNNLEIEKLKNQEQDLRYSQQMYDLQLATAEQNYQQTQESIKNREEGIDLQGSKINQEYYQANRETQLQDNQSKSQFNTSVSAAEQELQQTQESLRSRDEGIDLQGGRINQEYFQSLRDTQLMENQSKSQYNETVSGAKVQRNLQDAQAEQARGDALRELLRGISKDERQYAQFAALVGASGQRTGVQSANVRFDMLNNEEDASYRRSMMGRYGLSRGAAALGEQQTINSAGNTRRLEQQTIGNRYRSAEENQLLAQRFNEFDRRNNQLAKGVAQQDYQQALNRAGNTRGLDQQMIGNRYLTVGENRDLGQAFNQYDRRTNQLAGRDALADFGEQRASILGQKRREYDVTQSGLGISRFGIGLEGQSAAVDAAGREAALELQTAELRNKSATDFFQKSLLPEAREMGSFMYNNFNSMLQQQQLNAQNSVRQTQAEQGRISTTRQGLIDTEAAKGAFDLIPQQYALNANSNVASYIANQGNTKMQEYAGLNRIGAETHGLLSQLGGYRSPPPG